MSALKNAFHDELEARRAAEAGEANTYRGWSVSFEYGRDYDALYEGAEDGWVDNGHKAEGRTLDELYTEIDEWFVENGQFGVGA